MWHTIIAEWRTWLTIAGRRTGTINLRTYQLGAFADAHAQRDPWSITVDDLARWLASHPWTPGTIKSNRAALSTFYGWAFRTGRTDHDPSALLPPIHVPSRPARPAPESALIEALWRAPERVRLMIALAARLGLRRAEIAQIHVTDVVQAIGSGWTLIVHGKGGRDRTIPLPDHLAAALRRATDWVFPSPAGGHLSADYVGRLIARYLPHPWTAHSLRHRFATVAYLGTRDLLAVQELLGHSRPETTRGYIALPEDALRAAISAAA